MFRTISIALTAVVFTLPAYAQGSPSGSATLSQSPAANTVDCPVIVAGVVNMPEVIAELGSAQAIYDLSQGQIAEYDRWFVEMEAARGQGVAEAQINALIAEARANYDIELEVSQAALCYMNQ